MLKQGIGDDDDISRATNVMIGQKHASVFGYGDVKLSCTFAIRGSGARTSNAELYPICALRVRVEGFQVAAIESIVSEIDIFGSSKGNFDIRRVLAGVPIPRDCFGV